jgi:hypothetical protein
MKKLKKFMEQNQETYLGEKERKEKEESLAMALRSLCNKMAKGEIRLDSMRISNSEEPFKMKTMSHILTDYSDGTCFKLDISV